MRGGYTYPIYYQRVVSVEKGSNLYIALGHAEVTLT
jgi:hypothetical protein